MTKLSELAEELLPKCPRCGDKDSENNFMMGKCQFYENCGFLNSFQKSEERMREGWIKSFCKSKEKSETCRRKILYRQNGCLPPDNVMPTGKILQQDN